MSKIYLSVLLNYFDFNRLVILKIAAVVIVVKVIIINLSSRLTRYYADSCQIRRGVSGTVHCEVSRFIGVVGNNKVAAITLLCSSPLLLPP